MHEARYWHKREDGRIECDLCPHHCRLKDGQTGFCSVRKHIDGKLYALTYGKVSAVHDDPIEKKPLYHFYPGRNILSIGGIGCSFACEFCQNWELVEGLVRLIDLPPRKLLHAVEEYGSIGVAYTYNEPLIQFEYVLDCAKLLREHGKVNVLVTNGYLEPEPFDELIPYIDALNIDLKFADEKLYRKLCKGEPQPVIRNIRAAHEAGAHVEVTNLIVTGANDDEESIRKIIDTIAAIDSEIPLHFSRYFPHRNYREPPTNPQILIKAWEMAKEKLAYVYLGNLPTDVHSNTYCPSCSSLLIARTGYFTRVVGLDGNRCASCGREIKGRF